MSHARLNKSWVPPTGIKGSLRTNMHLPFSFVGDSEGA